MAKKPRQKGGDTRSTVQKALDAERAERALEMRKRGASFTAIAKALGYSAKQGAHNAVTRAIQAIAHDAAEEVRTLELARLDKIFRGLVSAGAFRGDPKAASAALRVMERRAKYLGLDAPTTMKLDGKVELDTAGAHDDLLSRIARLAASLGGGEGDRKTDA